MKSAADTALLKNAQTTEYLKASWWVGISSTKYTNIFVREICLRETLGKQRGTFSQRAMGTFTSLLYMMLTVYWRTTENPATVLYKNTILLRWMNPCSCSLTQRTHVASFVLWPTRMGHFTGNPNHATQTLPAYHNSVTSFSQRTSRSSF
jgi:hypothetical protein